MAIPSLSTSSAPVGETRRKPAINGETREALAAYLFLIPYLFVLLVFFIVAGVYGIGLSLFKVDIGFTSPEFIGLRITRISFSSSHTLVIATSGPRWWLY